MSVCLVSLSTAHASATDATDAMLPWRVLGRVDVARLGALPVGVTGVVVRCCC